MSTSTTNGHPGPSNGLSTPLSNDLSLHGYPPAGGPTPLLTDPGDLQGLPSPSPGPPSAGPAANGGAQWGIVPAQVSWEPSHRASGPAELVLARKHAERELISLLIERSGVSQAELARRMGITPQALGQYVKAKRRATFHWLVRLAQVSGAKVSVEFPSLAAPISVRATTESF